MYGKEEILSIIRNFSISSQAHKKQPLLMNKAIRIRVDHSKKEMSVDDGALSHSALAHPFRKMKDE